MPLRQQPARRGRMTRSTRLCDAALLLGLVLGAAVLVSFGFADLWRANWRTNDFSGYWAGAHAVVAGRDPYDPLTWRQLLATFVDQTDEVPVYGFPGWIALGLVPFGLLPVGAAAIAWLALGLGLAVAGLRALLREFDAGLPIVDALAGATLLGSLPGIMTFYSGQWTFLLVGLVSLSVVWLRRREGARGGAAWALAFLAKPHLFLLGAPAQLAAARARLDGRAAWIASVVVVAAVVVSLLVLPGWLSAYVREVAFARAPDPPRAAIIGAALFDLLGPLGLWLAVALIVLACVIALRLDPSSDAWTAAWLAISFGATVYSWSYDHLLFVVPLVIATGVVARRSRGRAAAVMGIGASLLLVAELLLYQVAAASGRQTLNGLVSLALVGIVLVAVWPERGQGIPLLSARNGTERRPVQP